MFLSHLGNRLNITAAVGGVEAIAQMGLKRWMDLQLHPDRITENLLLLRCLQPLESLQLSIREAYLRYPPPQLIRAVARGRGELPDHPERRMLATRLAERYLQKKRLDPPAMLSGTSASMPQNSNDLSDLEGRLHLIDVLKADQIETLQRGKPEEKKQLLQALPADKQSDFVWALAPKERQRLLAFAPVPLRRELMRSVAPQNVIAMDLIEGKVLRAVYSNRQLQELMVDFGLNHFNVFLNKGADRYTVPAYERDAIRPHVFGNVSRPPARNSKKSGHAVLPRQLAISRAGEGTSHEATECWTQTRPEPELRSRVARATYPWCGWRLHTRRRNRSGALLYRMDHCGRPEKAAVLTITTDSTTKGERSVLGYLIPAGGGMSDGSTVIEHTDSPSLYGPIYLTQARSPLCSR